MTASNLSLFIREYQAPMAAISQHWFPDESGEKHDRRARKAILKEYDKARCQVHSKARKEYMRKAGFAIAMGVVCGMTLATSLVSVAAVAACTLLLCRREQKKFLIRNRELQKAHCQIVRALTQQGNTLNESAPQAESDVAIPSDEITELAVKEITKTIASHVRWGHIENRGGHWMPKQAHVKPNTPQLAAA